MLLNCGVGEDSWVSLGLQEIKPVQSQGDQPWDFFGRNDAKAEGPVLWPPHAKSWLIGKDFDVGRNWGQEEKGTTGWDGWMASLTRWMWIWVNSGSWWWTGRPGVLWFMGSKRVGHDWATELNWTESCSFLDQTLVFMLLLAVLCNMVATVLTWTIEWNLNASAISLFYSCAWAKVPAFCLSWLISKLLFNVR